MGSPKMDSQFLEKKALTSLAAASREQVLEEVRSVGGLGVLETFEFRVYRFLESLGLRAWSMHFRASR